VGSSNAFAQTNQEIQPALGAQFFIRGGQ
jgi:hypothetical protein